MSKRTKNNAVIIDSTQKKNVELPNNGRTGLENVTLRKYELQKDPIISWNFFCIINVSDCKDIIFLH